MREAKAGQRTTTWSWSIIICAAGRHCQHRTSENIQLPWDRKNWEPQSPDDRPCGTVPLADQVDLSGCFWMSQDRDLCILQLTRKEASTFIFLFPSEGACEVRDQEAWGGSTGFLPVRLLMTLIQAKLNFTPPFQLPPVLEKCASIDLRPEVRIHDPHPGFYTCLLHVPDNSVSLGLNFFLC